MPSVQQYISVKGGAIDYFYPQLLLLTTDFIKHSMGKQFSVKFCGVSFFCGIPTLIATRFNSLEKYPPGVDGKIS
jgi:hypothetical protein